MRYFFNESCRADLRDDTGLELANHNEARIMAVKYASEMLRDHPTLIWSGEDFRVEVEDEAGLLQFTIVIVGVDAPAAQGAA
ncbi:MAG TPA: hypothetical protein VGC35_11240 [Allosphingosinicella sp.]|jgi:hypothetical protein